MIRTQSTVLKNPRPRLRRWRQYSLRSIFPLVTFVAITVFVWPTVWPRLQNVIDQLIYTPQELREVRLLRDLEYVESLEISKYFELSEQRDKSAEKLGQAIKEEIRTLGDHEWAGEYYYGNGMGVNVSMVLAPKLGYLFEWYGSLGLYDRNFGDVVPSDDRLRLTFTFANKREAFSGIAEEFFPVAWGDRKYLIPSDDVVGFCNAVNAGSEPRSGLHGFYLLRLGDEQKKVTGFPVVPPKFRPHLLAGPIECKIIEVGNSTTRPSVAEWKFKDTLVTLDVGKKDGILPDIELQVVQPDGIFESVTIQEVEEERSEGVMTQIGKEEERPRIGWRLSTRSPWNME